MSEVIKFREIREDAEIKEGLSLMFKRGMPEADIIDLFVSVNKIRRDFLAKIPVEAIVSAHNHMAQNKCHLQAAVDGRAATKEMCRKNVTTGKHCKELQDWLISLEPQEER